MTRLTWDALGQRFFEAGCDRGVLYVGSAAGVPWTGLISVTEAPSGGDVSPYYLDGIKYLNVVGSTEYAATIEAFTYPREFEVCEGTLYSGTGLLVTEQPKTQFGLSYRTLLGNDVLGTSYGYKLHLVYNALVAPSEREHGTLNESSDPGTFSWGITATPPPVTGFKPTAHYVIDSSRASTAVMTQIENILYGTSSTAPRLPLPTELVSIFAA